MKRILLSILIIGIPLLLGACATPSAPSVEPSPVLPPVSIDEEANVEAAIRGFYDAYNSGEVIRCTTYLTNISEEDKTEIETALILGRKLSGEFVIREVKNLIVKDNKASVDVVLTLGGETKIKHWSLTKEGVDWKLVWEEESSEEQVSPPVAEQPVPKAEPGFSRDKPAPMKEPVLTTEGIAIGVADAVRGDLAWKMIAEDWLDPPGEGDECLLILVGAENIASDKEPFGVSWLYFDLVGSSNKIIDDHILGLPDEGPYKKLDGKLYHKGRETGIVGFYIPKDETDLVLIWDHFAFSEKDKRFFEIDARTE